MNLLEALETGLPYKHKSWTHYSEVYPGDKTVRIYLHIDTILSNDWEVKEEVVELSKEMFLRGLSEYAKDTYNRSGFYGTREDFVTWTLNNASKLWEFLSKKGKVK